MSSDNIIINQSADMDDMRAPIAVLEMTSETPEKSEKKTPIRRLTHFYQNVKVPEPSWLGVLSPSEKS